MGPPRMFLWVSRTRMESGAVGSGTGPRSPQPKMAPAAQDGSPHSLGFKQAFKMLFSKWLFLLLQTTVSRRDFGERTGMVFVN